VYTIKDTDLEPDMVEHTIRGFHYILLRTVDEPGFCPYREINVVEKGRFYDISFSMGLDNRPIGKREYTEETLNMAVDTIRKDFGDVFDELNKKLIECEARIAGSYVLQVLNQEKYEDSDIDIFCPDSNFNVLSVFLNSIGATMYHKYGEYAFHHDNPIISVYDFRYMDKKIQVITVSCPVEKFLETFDISFCKASWDGKSLYPTEPSEMEDILNHKGVYCGDGIHYTRIRKYVERGYIISFEK
jgi:hypothetical protein